jgi:4-amino-4-deoxychorismate lyase
LEQVLARAEWNDSSIQEGIMLDNDDYVIEGTMTNLFFIKRDMIYTAKLDKSGVAGIIRSIIMEQSANYGLNVFEDKITKDELLTADEVFVCNSVIGIWPVRQIEQQHFLVGPITRQIQYDIEQSQHEVSAE